MKKQLFFNMPVVDSKETKKAVEEVLENYRECLSTLPNDIMPKVTTSFSEVPPTFTNEFNSSTENVALERIELEQERDEYMNWVINGVNNLKPDERFIIFKGYMEEEPETDLNIWLELGVGKTKFYKLKGSALLRLAFNLKVEVYKKATKQKEVKKA
ncbi:ArpU family transcriptional regulator [Bacillus manliponensis]|uniref:ArpU family transcriptional regulator n=1 Tax=Bacillus manliponensis TaxID=574376 RepID=A0A073JTP1_9BACI|nr:ArpU family phage packaging/lysis transcriptional regulator [Bacillus manliponensis]KEK17556.1 ArpU family transcriptional regulator [Bacillus manliponensis]